MNRWRIVPQADDKGIVCPGAALLVTTGDGFAVAVTAEELASALRIYTGMHVTTGDGDRLAALLAEVAALTRPADGDDA